MKERLEERLAVYREIEGRIRAEHGEPESYPATGLHQYLTLRAGVRVAEARLAWCHEALDALETSRAVREPLETGVV